jgi:DNA processing protein
VKDVEYLLDWIPSPNAKQADTQLSLPLNLFGEEKTVAEYLYECGSSSFDQLQTAVEIPQTKLTMVLLNMEMQDLVIALPGKRYRLR